MFELLKTKSLGISPSLHAVLFLFTCSLRGCVCVQASSSDQIIILVSYDGFRYDYLDKYKEVLPTLTKLASDGVRADYIHNVFPTETCPNHYSIVTGLYPESHGIIANAMYDPVLNATFSPSTNDSRWWQNGEPIWVTSEKQGRKAGVCYWPGYDVVIKGYQPTYRPLNTSYGKSYAGMAHLMPWKERVDTIIGWLNKTIPPVFVSVHFEEPDKTGHSYGTDSLEMKNILKKLDNNAWYFMKQLRRLTIFHRINIIFTSDHGMMNFQSKNVVDIDKYANPELYTYWSPGPATFLVTNSSKSSLDELYQKFKTAEDETRLIKFYRRDDIPGNYHYRHNRRIADILGVLNPGFVLKFGKVLPNHTYGTHGYDTTPPQMHPYFVAYGPVFKKGYRSGPIEMIDLYSLMCHILDLKPAPNNGSLSRIQHLLEPSDQSNNTKVAVVISATLIGLMCFVIILLLLKRSRNWGDETSVRFNRRMADSHQPLMETDDEEDEVVFMSAWR